MFVCVCVCVCVCMCVYILQTDLPLFEDNLRDTPRQIPFNYCRHLLGFS